MLACHGITWAQSQGPISNISCYLHMFSGCFDSLSHFWNLVCLNLPSLSSVFVSRVNSWIWHPMVLQIMWFRLKKSFIELQPWPTSWSRPIREIFSIILALRKKLKSAQLVLDNEVQESEAILGAWVIAECHVQSGFDSDLPLAGLMKWSVAQRKPQEFHSDTKEL